MLTEISAASLREVLEYRADDGGFVWRKHANPQLIGTVAGYLTEKGYRRITIGMRGYRAHRLAWLYVHGCWPAGWLDHINRDRDDNRISNLREADGSENHLNSDRKYSVHPRGVSYSPSRRKWRAQIKRQGKYLLQQYFDTQDQAIAARNVALAAAYGEFANLPSSSDREGRR